MVLRCVVPASSGGVGGGGGKQAGVEATARVPKRLKFKDVCETLWFLLGLPATEIGCENGFQAAERLRCDHKQTERKRNR